MKRQGQGDMIGVDEAQLSNASEAALDAVPPEAWAKELVRFIEVLEAAYERKGFDQEKATEIARLGVLTLAEFNGGRQWYLPRGDRLKTALRDAVIYRRARRGNIPLLATEYDLTTIHVWRILRQQHALHVRRVQPDLFGTAS